MSRPCQGAHGFGTAYSYAELEGLWVKNGGSKALAPVMAAIAMAESGGCSSAENPSGASGLWQILGNPFPGDAFNPNVNAKMAVSKYKSQGLGAWTTYTGGQYKQYLKGKVPPNVNVNGGNANSGNSSGGGCPSFFSSPVGWVTCNSLGGAGSIGKYFLDPIDALERVGLVIFGGILILIGIAILGFGPAKEALQIAAGVSREGRAVGRIAGGGGSSAGPPSEDNSAERSKRLELAERNVELGERKQTFRENREVRLARRQSHRGRREPNPNPPHS